MSVEQICKSAKLAANELAMKDTAYKNKMLAVISSALKNNVEAVLAANLSDLQRAQEAGKDAVLIDRLRLTEQRVRDMAQGVDEIIALPDPVGEITRQWTASSGIVIRKVRAPLGVIGIIYEARPNVTIDALALCIKSGNSAVLRGSKDALSSNVALYTVVTDALRAEGLLSDAVQLISSPDYEATRALLKQKQYVDVIIPRGGNGLKNFVVENALMPVIASAGGNCHVYVEKTADLTKAVDVIINAKVQRPGVCNAAEQLLIDREIAPVFLPVITEALRDKGVQLLGCEKCRAICPDIAPATEEDYYTEHLALKMSIKIVDGYTEAIERINQHGTAHSEAILSESSKAVQAFFTGVDAAALYHNASTRFTDGFQFGYGAEMGISTQKLHVRGPVALEALTSEKYLVTGDYASRK